MNAPTHPANGPTRPTQPGEPSTYAINLRLEDDVVLTRRNATVGKHESLDFIPGSALLGWVASRLYARLPAPQAWQVFHSGQVRFGDALVCDDRGARCLPVPLAWHAQKGQLDDRGREVTRLDGRSIRNLSVGAAPTGQQLKQMRDGYVSGDGGLWRPTRSYRLMTAIGDDGRAADQQLFGYEALRAGQDFQSLLTFDTVVPAGVREQVLACLRGMVRIGRSKATQYGRVRSEVHPVAAADDLSDFKDSARLRLWLTSDAWLHTPEGLPTLGDDARALGLSGARLVAVDSFVRSRRYSPWNGHRRHHEVERQVVCAGSVLTFERESGFTAAEMRALAASGVGWGRAAGLGSVAVQPVLLATEHPVFDSRPAGLQSPVALGSAATRTNSPPDTPLIRFLLRQTGQHAAPARAHGWARTSASEFLQHLQAIRRFNGVGEHLPCGPGRSQWGALGDAALQARSLDLLRDRVLKGQGALCKETDTLWKLAAAVTPSSLRDRVAAMLDSLAGFDAWDAQSYAWQWLCTEMRRLNAAESARHLDLAVAELAASASKDHRAAAPAPTENPA